MEGRSEAGQAAAAGAAEGARRRQLLFADDNPGMQETVAHLLADTGYEFLGARSGIDALCLIAESRPDLVLVDTACPELDGFQLCALLREREEFAGLPVVLLSDKTDPFEEVKARALGARGILRKPFGKAELLAALGGERGDG